MIALLACCFALSTCQQEGRVLAKTELPMPPKSPVKEFLYSFPDPLDPPHPSSKKFGADGIQWQFPCMVGGLSEIEGQPTNNVMRFLVYAQDQKGNPALAVARMYMR